MSTLKLSITQWIKIRTELHNEHPKSVFMLKNKMRQVLGFTVREHGDYRPGTANEIKDYDGSTGIGSYQYFRENIFEHIICLDFYNERKYTMFLLKYSEFINDNR